MNALMPVLPREIRDRLNRIFSSYLHRCGVDGAVNRFRNRTIAIT